MAMRSTTTPRAARAAGTRGLAALLAAAALAQAGPAAAEVVEAGEGAFVTRHVRVVEASPREAWMALISPARWWSDGHTWSGDAANLTLTPQAGGCFCERIPEVDTAETVGLAGSVRHMEVIYAAPDSALRMRGALGPLQSEAVTGVLTIAFDAQEDGTAVTFEYVVGGYMRYETAKIAAAVDAVIAQQLDGLATLLGPADSPAAPEQPAEQPAEGGAAGEKGEEAAPDADEGAGAGVDEGAREAPARESVEQAFEDLSDG
ncbi:SRPBCC family protein [Pelagerythrobacter marinus]|uniref:SRPBCC family protein n=1 Tax=Pelagerythrobacter marinus TaxID=538382 RepID=UPI0020376358|nr:SRPBCC family protein [Pelagerythrobacter marinus]USA40953.1 SRPBCC family protein [Pelagerythrobacter marinus]WPZ07873.1 SRPBCC family protein [Pelagerythrobacter marinus]